MLLKVEFIRSLRDSNYLSHESLAFFSLDGEEIQIRNVMNRIDFFNEISVIVAKRAASLSHFGNALDAGNIHKATKTRQKNMSDKEAHHGKDGVIAAIMGYLRAELPQLTKAKCKHIAEACVRVASAFQFTLSPTMILHSFEKCAQRLPSTLDAKLALYPKISEVGSTEIESMRKVFPSHVEVVRATGKITEAMMDMAGKPASFTNDRRKVPKDERVLHQQRSCILNGAEVVEQYRANLKRKEELASNRLQSGKKAKRSRCNPETGDRNGTVNRRLSNASKVRKFKSKYPLLTEDDENVVPRSASQDSEIVYL